MVVGGTSVSGKTAFEAIKELDAANEIITTTSRDNKVDGADITITGISLTEDSAEEKILGSGHCRDIDYMIYIPARGQVGIKAEEATRDMVEESLNYSFRPFLRLAKELKPRKSHGADSREAPR